MQGNAESYVARCVHAYNKTDITVRAAYIGNAHLRNSNREHCFGPAEVVCLQGDLRVRNAHIHDGLDMICAVALQAFVLLMYRLRPGLFFCRNRYCQYRCTLEA